MKREPIGIELLRSWWSPNSSYMSYICLWACSQKFIELLIATTSGLKSRATVVRQCARTSITLSSDTPC
jgi:hypothetical protein